MYLSKDPIGLAGNNPTLYGYVKDTNSWIDSYGLMEQGRDELGKFLPKNIGDAIPGSDAVSKVRAQFEVDPKYKILGEEISFTDGTQVRRYDLVVENLDTGKVSGIEVKSSLTASYGRVQKTFDSKVNSGDTSIRPIGAKAEEAGIKKIDDVRVIRCK
jgi:uncharacterized protein RhaS with RHS repeats